MRSTVLLVAFSTMSVLACGGKDTVGPGTGNGTPTVATVVVTPGNATLVSLGETVQLTASALDANGNTISGKTFTWSSSDESLVTVSSSGLATAIGNGVATIMATTEGVQGSASLTVAQVASRVEVTPASATVFPPGATVQLAASAEDAKGNAISDKTFTWSSSDESIATVSSSGLVTAVANGSVTITATVEGQSGMATVTVIALEFASVSAGWSHTCGVTTLGTAYCWGLRQFGQLGDGTAGGGVTMTPVAVSGGLTFASVSGGGSHTCGLTTAGSAYCWGSNRFYGQLGDGTLTDRSTPVEVSGGLTFASVSARGRDHSCGLTTSGTAYCWGRAWDGQLGNNQFNSANVPQAVAGGFTFNQLIAGPGHTCAIRTTGETMCWGANWSGQLGDGTFNSRGLPATVPGGLSFIDLGAGNEHTCGVTAGGSLYCWGSNIEGQLGLGFTIKFSTPTIVAGGLTFVTPPPVEY
ncbi:MAG: Ig-like domain-containing protein [Gemmatimonadetes bacterium]|nr:Ig-like domain-containing protein [Gemmatimonadota bacterium]